MGRKSDAKERLMETALELIWENSYHAVGVNEICTKAGVKPGSFYYFFPSKQDLALAALEFHKNQAQDMILEPAFQPDIPPLDRIKRMFEYVYAFHSARSKENNLVLGCAFGSFVGELGKDDEEIRQKIQNIFSAIRSYFETALEEAVAAKELAATPEEIADTAKALFAFYQGMLLIARAQNNAEIIRELIPQALKLIHS